MARYQQCNGVTRRNAMRVGMLGTAGLTMGSFLRLADGGLVNDRARSKRAIFIELPGGPSHIDTFDLKPEAPSEYRGLFRPISTNVSGVKICEHLPRLAQNADKFAIIRGVSHSLGAHPLGQQFVFSGNRPTPSLDYPGYGSVVAREIEGPADLPSYVAIPKANKGPGHLGVKYAPLETNGVPRKGQKFNVRGISLAGGLTLEEIDRRQNLLRDLDRKFQTIQHDNELLSGLDKFSQKAYEIITSRKARDAFDTSLVKPSFAKLFGEDEFSQSCLLATRLVESGVSFVTINFPGWDTHQENFERLKDKQLPKLDAGLSGLLMGLQQKGLLESTTVFVTGEFGRTPKVNNKSATGGRDHYPRCMFMLMAGGPVLGGQVIGESDEKATGPRHEGIHPEDVAATFYQTLGIDHRKEYDTSIGRPISVVRDGNVISELVM